MSIRVAYMSGGEDDRQKALQLVEAAWNKLVSEVKRHWKKNFQLEKVYNHVRVELLGEPPFKDDSEETVIISMFNEKLRRTRVDTLVCFYNSPGVSYSKKNCVFFHGEIEQKSQEEMVWEIGHELCHSFGAAHALEGIMSRSYSTQEEFLLDDQAALTLQQTAFYHPAEEQKLKEIHTDYLTETFVKRGENGYLTLKFACRRSGPRWIYFLDQRMKN